MHILVIGAGYVGCVTGACLARLGHHVTAVDIDQQKIELLKSGRSPVSEPGLDELLKTQCDEGRFAATSDLASAVPKADAALVCVGTPSLESGAPDARTLRTVLLQLADLVEERQHPLLTLVRCTVPAPSVRQIMAEMPGTQAGLEIVVNPEFLREASGIRDFFEPPFMVFGADDPEYCQKAAALYTGIAADAYYLDIETASLLKYACNAFHALKVGFTNEIAALAERLGANANTIMDLFRRDKQLNVSTAYLRPGFAFGGSCLPKDLRALECLGQSLKADIPILSHVLASNDARLMEASALIDTLGVRKIAMIGLSFKKGSDDLRESPYLRLAAELSRRGCVLQIYDPDLNMDALTGANRDYAESIFPQLADALCSSFEETLEDRQLVVLCKDQLDDAQGEALCATTMPILDLEYIAYRRRWEAQSLLTLGSPLESRGRAA